VTEDLLLLMQKELELLRNAARVLGYSYEKCSRIGIKDAYDDDELDKFESLTSRFARLGDILIQKIFRLIDELDLDAAGTVRDRINRAEKKGLIDSADVFIEIRMLRNDIAHEYVPEEIIELFKKVLKATPLLISSVAKVEHYCIRYLSR